MFISDPLFENTIAYILSCVKVGFGVRARRTTDEIITKKNKPWRKIAILRRNTCKNENYD